MKKSAMNAALVALLIGLAGFSTPSLAETGQVAVVFTKGGFIIGAGAGEGVLVLRGKRYPFTVSGIYDRCLDNQARRTGPQCQRAAFD